MPNLRARLRLETSALHGRVDRVFSTFDPGCSVGLASLLQAQGAAVGAVRCLPGADAAEALALRDEMLEAVRADLRCLGVALPEALGPAYLHPTSVRYVLLGSRMGMRVLHRRWAASKDPAVAVAYRSLGLSPGGAWRRFCEETGRVPEGSPLADLIVRDALRLFTLFAAGAERVNVPSSVSRSGSNRLQVSGETQMGYAASRPASGSPPQSDR